MILSFKDYIVEELTKHEKRTKYFLDKSNKGGIKIDKSDIDNYDIPEPIKIEMKKWDNIYKSPHSDSFYDIDEFKVNLKTLSVGKPDGLYRVSDHWNYTSFRDNKKHSITDIPVKNNYVTLAKYDKDSDLFKVILSYPSSKYLKHTEDKKKSLSHLTDPDTIYKKKLFKDRVSNREILVDATLNDEEYHGVLSKWTGFEIRIENNEGDVIVSKSFKRSGIPLSKVKVKLTDRSGNPVEDPFKLGSRKDPNRER